MIDKLKKKVNKPWPVFLARSHARWILNKLELLEEYRKTIQWYQKRFGYMDHILAEEKKDV